MTKTIEQILHQLEKKPIFICIPQKVENSQGVVFELPKCNYVKIGWDDWQKFKEDLLKCQRR